MKPLAQQNATDGHTGDVMAAVLAEAEALCHRVAGRDLGETPLYIVPQSNLPEECGPGDHCYGYTTPSLDIYLAPHIPNYRGRGPCMVINDIALAEDYEPRDAEYLTRAHVLHELAHILDRPALFKDRSGENPDKLLFESLVVANATQRPARRDIPAYFGHEAGFIRIVLHLCHRAERAGVHVSPIVICAGHRFGLSPASVYREALGDEPHRCADMTFREILATRPPRAFSSLWCDDFIAYHERFPFQKGLNR